MAAVGAVRIGRRIGYFAIVNGKNCTRIYIEDDEDDALLQALADANWKEYLNYLELIFEANQKLREKSFKELVFSLKNGYGLLAIPQMEEGLSYSISDPYGAAISSILSDDPGEACDALASLYSSQP